MGNAEPKRSALRLWAPMRGWSAPLAEVPDAVFSGRLMGDGLAIDPVEGILRAPCDGVIIQAARHAVTLRAWNGAEILMHVGLDTVALDGQGFKAAISEGQLVTVGQTLLEFDLEFLALRARSMMSPIVVTNGEAFRILTRVQDREVTPGGVLLEIVPADAAESAPATAEQESREVVVRLPHGIHARPAAGLADAARRFAAACFIVSRDRRADARSISALMALGVRSGDRIAIEARGKDAGPAADMLARLLASASDEPPLPIRRTKTAEAALPAPAPDVLRGVRAAPGIALGVAVMLQAGDSAPEEAGLDVAEETARLERALAALRRRLEAASLGAGSHGRGILAAHAALLEDPQIIDAALAQIAQGKSAGFAFRHAVRGQAEIFRALDDSRLQERAADLMDLERQLLAILAGNAPAATALPDRAIVIAEELLPSELLALDRDRLAGIATSGGGPTSHVAILAAAMGIPALVGLGAKLMGLAEGAALLLDADAGILRLAPDEAAAGAARARIAAQFQAREAARAAAAAECRTADGGRIEIFVNLGSGREEAARAVEQGAEGCGLLRTEFLFMERDSPPGEEEQFARYQAIAQALDGRPLILRTFDIGGDKPAPYMQFPREDNPMLGLRGIRAGLHWPELLRTQLSAALRVRPAGQCRIMLPMVSSVTEIRTVRALIRELAGDAPVALGAMVETPAAALLADQLLAEADFLSIGTNDLTQYVLAMDRGNPLLASRIDALHPAVLRLIAASAAAGAAAGKPVCVCGGLAADTMAAPLLVGLGISELSMPAAAIGAAKAMIGSLTLAQCRQAADEALGLGTADAVRALLQERFGGQA